MATFDKYKAGLRSVGNYQVAGWPFITGSTGLAQNTAQRVAFPSVTRSVTVINKQSSAGEDIRVHFQGGHLSGSSLSTPTAVTAGPIRPCYNYAIADADDVITYRHFITIPAGNASMTFDVKCKEIYVSTNHSNAGDGAFTYEVFAELTGIPTGSHWNVFPVNATMEALHLTGSGITHGGASGGDV